MADLGLKHPSQATSHLNWRGAADAYRLLPREKGLRSVPRQTREREEEYRPEIATGLEQTRRLRNPTKWCAFASATLDVAFMASCEPPAATKFRQPRIFDRTDTEFTSRGTQRVG